jgi:hypothetical protein
MSSPTPTDAGPAARAVLADDERLMREPLRQALAEAWPSLQERRIAQPCRPWPSARPACRACCSDLRSGSIRTGPHACAGSRRPSARRSSFRVDEVLFFISDEKSTRVQTATTEALIRKPIKELLQELDLDQFWQIHRSTLVNVRAIAGVHRDERGRQLVIVRGHPERLEVSRSYQGWFRGM